MPLPSDPEHVARQGFQVAALPGRLRFESCPQDGLELRGAGFVLAQGFPDVDSAPVEEADLQPAVGAEPCLLYTSPSPRD